MRRIVASVFLFSIVYISHAQEVAVDSKGEPVFQFYSLNDARLQFTRRAPITGSYVFHKEGSKSNSRTLLQLSILNSGDFLFVQKLRDVRPGAGIKYGYHKAIGEFSSIDQAKRRSVHTWGVNGFFSIDNIKLYDTTKGLTEKRYPVIYGVEGNYSFFFKNKVQGSSFRKALSFYAAVSSSWNDRNLLSYQQISRIVSRPDVIAMQDFGGRYGALKKNFLKYRMAISFPMFYKRFNPTPYWVGIFGTQNSPSYHMGVFTNILASSLNKSNSKMPSTFGVGFDWVYATEHLSSKVNLFLKASISLGKLKEE